MLEERLVHREVVFEGRYVRTEVRTVRLPDGKESTREIVSPPDAVGILPVDASGHVYLVRQYRTALERVILEIPAGILEAGESPENTGRRECEEEVSMIPGRMERLCGFYHSVGFSTGRIEIYLATDLKPSPHVHNEHGEFLERVIMPFDDLYRRVLSGEIVDSKTLVATLWYRDRIPTCINK
jgi:ADP-ribose pyrophosphatase